MLKLATKMNFKPYIMKNVELHQSLYEMYKQNME